MPAAIICAMDEELNLLKERLNLKEVPHSAPWPLFASPDGSILAAICGIGKVNAAACLSYLISQHRPDKIIGIGVAGGLAPDLKIGDILIVRDALQHDVDVSAFGYQKGEIPRIEVSAFQADEALLQFTLKCADRIELDVNIREGRIISGDRFVASDEGLSLGEEFQADCVDMESAAWAQVAYLYQVPWIVIRSISDQANGKAPDDFGAFLHHAVSNMSLLVENLLALV